MKEIIKNVYDWVDNKFYFRLLYLFVSLTFVTILKDIPGIKIFGNIALAWGMLLILFMVIEDYKRRKIYKFDLPLILFMIITLMFNFFVYRNTENIKVWIVNLILVVLIFTIDVFRNKKTLIKEMNLITYFYVIFMSVASIISLAMKFTGYTIEINQVVFGATRGVFENENALGIAAGLAIVMCIYLNYVTKSTKVKMFWVGNIVLQTITMIGSNGRSAYLIVIAIVYTFIFVYNKNKYIRIALVLAPILFCVAFYQLDKSHIESFTTERNNIWTSAAIVIDAHPLTGVGNGSLVEAVTNARIGWYLPGMEFGGMHNIYVEIAAVNGIISLLLFLTFLGIILMFIIQHLDKLQRKEKIQMTTLTSLVVGILAVNLFESTLIYKISFISMIFWIYAGYLVSILDNKNID